MTDNRRIVFFSPMTKVDYESFARRVCPRLIATVCS